ncbi:MAG: 50S ribosomal protein L33 [Polyangiaceae bacterium]
MREKLMLKCGNCGRHNYVRTKNKRTMTQKFEIKKYCPDCRGHHNHKESKISKG